MRRNELFAALIAACSLCASGALAAQAPRYGGTVVVAGQVDLQGMNSLTVSESSTREFTEHVLFLPLISYRRDLSYEPALARTWRMLGDTGVIFNLRRDVLWHDGVKTTAYDVAFTFDRVKDKETGFPNAEWFDKWTAVHVVDSFTVRFAFTPHINPLQGLPGTAIMPKHLLDSIPSVRMAQAAFNHQPVGNGPFRFVSYRANDRWTFEANPQFPRELGGRPYIDRLIWRVVPDATAQVAELLTSNVDITTVPGAQIPKLSENPDLKVVIKPSSRFTFITWNGKHAPFGDPRVRRALTMAIDRQKMIQIVRNGYGQVAAGPIPPYHWLFDTTLQPLPYDTTAARALLASAGLRDRNGDGVLEDAAGKPFTFDLIFPGTPLSKTSGELIRADLERIGVKVNTRTVDFATLIQKVSQPERDFDSAILAFTADLEPNLHDMFHSSAISGRFQSASYNNSAVDALLDRISKARDRKTALLAYRPLQRILRDEEPWTFLYYSPDLVAMRKRLQNVELDIRGLVVNPAKWWVTR